MCIFNMQTASSKGINIWLLLLLASVLYRIYHGFLTAEKRQWNLAIPRTVLERDCSFWTDHGKAPATLKRSFQFPMEMELVMRIKDSNCCCHRTQLLVTTDESAVNKMCVHGISAWVIYAKKCWIQRHHLWDSMKKKPRQIHLFVYSSWPLQ